MRIMTTDITETEVFGYLFFVEIKTVIKEDVFD